MRIVLLAVLFLAACGGRADQVEIRNATVSLSPLPGRPSSGYFELRDGSAGARVMSASSPRVGRIEFHVSEQRNGMMSMRQLRPEELRLNDVGELVFNSGGQHLMLFDVSRDVRPGDRIPITFRLQPGQSVTAQFEVRAAGDMRHMGH